MPSLFSARPQPAPDHCACGRDPKDAAVTWYDSISGTYTFHRCRCGMEWTDHTAGWELAAPPVTSAQVMEVHRQLQAFHGSLRTPSRRPVPA
jgi:hypothetical protein